MSLKRSFWSFVFLLGTMTMNGEAESKIKIIALGDSTTAGTPGFCSPRECPPHGQGDEQSQYAYWITKKNPNYEVVNQGVRGERSDHILKRFDADVLAYHSQGVIVLTGVNDLYRGSSVDVIQKNLIQIYDKAKRANIRVLACSVIPYNFSSPEVKQRMRVLNEWIRDYSREKGNGFCDTFKAVENPKKPGNLISSPDGLHPDKDGYRKMGEAIADCLNSILSSH